MRKLLQIEAGNLCGGIYGRYKNLALVGFKKPGPETQLDPVEL